MAPKAALLQEKILDAHERLWNAVADLRALPYPYGTIILFLHIYSPSEVADRLQDYDLSTQESDLYTLLQTKAKLDDSIRLYVDETLWSLVKTRITFIFRLLLIAGEAPSNSVTIDRWIDDVLIQRSLETAFTPEEIGRYEFTKTGAFSALIDDWDKRILDKIKQAQAELSQV